MKIKHIISAIGLSLIGVIGFVIYFTVFLNPFDFGHCDGHGEPDRYEKIYFDNGQERYRWEAGIDMKLHVHYTEINEVVQRY